MRANQRSRYTSSRSPEKWCVGGPAQRNFDVPDGQAGVDHAHRPGTGLPGTLFQQRANRRRLFPDDGRDLRLENARFLPGYRFQRITEELGVIKPYGCDGCDPRGEYIRGVQSTTQTSFDYRDIHLLLDEPVKREGGRQFEKSGTDFFSFRNPTVEKIEHRVFGDRLTVDGDPLAKVDEMR